MVSLSILQGLYMGSIVGRSKKMQKSPRDPTQSQLPSTIILDAFTISEERGITKRWWSVKQYPRQAVYQPEPAVPHSPAVGGSQTEPFDGAAG